LSTADSDYYRAHFGKEYPFQNLNQDFLFCFRRNVVKIRLAFLLGFFIFGTQPGRVWLWIERSENTTQVDRHEAD
jgi:hypothetical protein